MPVVLNFKFTIDTFMKIHENPRKYKKPVLLGEKFNDLPWNKYKPMRVKWGNTLNIKLFLKFEINILINRDLFYLLVQN